MALVIKANGEKLPSPVQINLGEEIIWSNETGRGDNGKMHGDVIAEKQTLSIKWEYLTKAEKKLIQKHLKAGFFKIQLIFSDETVNLTQYRGTLNSEMLGYIGDGICYYKTVSVELIEQ